MAKSTALFAQSLYGVAAAEQALRIAHGERKAAERERESVRVSSTETIHFARGIEATLRQAAAIQDLERNETLEDLVLALNSEEDQKPISALVQIQKDLGNDPVISDIASFARLRRSRSQPVVIEPCRTPVDGEANTRVSSLGEPCRPPLPAPGEAILRAMVSDSRARWTRNHAGLHVVVNRRGKPYAHHGIYLGDGSVIHFTGEPPHLVGDSSVDGGFQKAARVERISLQQFVGEDGLERTTSLALQRISGETVATLDPAVICYRALSRLGDEEYKLVRNNCEHLCTWAQIGASFSFQIERVQVLFSPRTRARRSVTKTLAQRIEPDDRPLPADILVEGQDDAYPIDLARAYWDRDRQELVTWFPLWSNNGEAPADADRPWTVGAPVPGSVWHATSPSLDLDPDWHASLVSFGSRQAFWVDPEGQWFDSGLQLDEVIEERLAITQDLVSSLMAAPSWITQAAVDLAEVAAQRRQPL